VSCLGCLCPAVFEIQCFSVEATATIASPSFSVLNPPDKVKRDGGINFYDDILSWSLVAWMDGPMTQPSSPVNRLIARKFS